MDVVITSRTGTTFYGRQNVGTLRGAKAIATALMKKWESVAEVAIWSNESHCYVEKKTRGGKWEYIGM